MKNFDPVNDLARRRAEERELHDRIEHKGEVRRMFPTPKLSDCTGPSPEAPAREKAVMQMMIDDVYAKRSK